MYTIYQLKKTIFSMEAAFAFAVALGCYIFFGEFYIQFDHDFLDTFTRVQDDGLLLVIFPMLVSLPAAVKAVPEFESGYFRLAIPKAAFRQYAVTRLAVNGLTGGALLTAPAALYLLRIIAAKGIQAEAYDLERNMIDIRLCQGLYDSYPMAYALLLLGGIFLCGAAFATLALGVGALTQKKYLALLLPQIYYVGTAIAFPKHVKALDATTLYVVNSNVHASLLVVLLYDLLLTAAGAFLFVKGVKKNVS